MCPNFIRLITLDYVSYQISQVWDFDVGYPREVVIGRIDDGELHGTTFIYPCLYSTFGLLYVDVPLWPRAYGGVGA